MSTNKSPEELTKHKLEALKKIDGFLSSLISSSNPKRQGKADKLSYWLNDYIKFLEFEENFSPSKLKKYKRGDILKVHFGYNIGSEEGGLHYAAVIEKDNSIHNPVITVVPLTSIKPSKDLTNLRKGEVLLGNELFLSLTSKFTETFNAANAENQSLKKYFSEFRKSVSQSPSFLDKLEEANKAIETKLELLERMKVEIYKMKHGSIALVNQITTISKIRIYDPKSSGDILSGIKLTNEGLDKIDQEIMKRYTK